MKESDEGVLEREERKGREGEEVAMGECNKGEERGEDVAEEGEEGAWE